MVLLLGATGYIGQGFAGELRRRGYEFIPLSRKAFDYTQLRLLFNYVRTMRPELVINAAGYAGRPNVDACELARMETFQANTLLPQTVARACVMTNTPWAHVSTGCIYTGAKMCENGEMRVERDLNRPEVRRSFDRHPENFLGFTELDGPNFSFRYPSFNFCSGTKALAEEAIRDCGPGYIWRPMMPFNERDAACNFLSRIQRYPRVYDHVTSLSHLGDCVQACLDLWGRRAPFGVYNVANPGAVTTRQVVEMIQRILKPTRQFEYWTDDDEFYSGGAKALRSNCILDVTKLVHTGVKMRNVQEALEDSLERWQPVGPNCCRVESLAVSPPCRRLRVQRSEPRGWRPEEARQTARTRKAAVRG
jgi:UDP-glucose 4,6-dehydratase